jgi:hypothetical protein
VISALRMHVRRLLLVELAAVGLLLTALTTATPARVVLLCAAAVIAGIAYGRWRHRFISGWIATLGSWALRRHRPPPAMIVDGGVIIDADGAVAVFEIGDATKLVMPAETPLPRLDHWASLSPRGGPRVHRQIVVRASRASAQAHLAVRACRAADGVDYADAAVLSALRAAARRTSRRLTHDGVPHRRLDDAELEALIGTPPDETWDGLTTASTAQITLRTARPADPMTQDLLVRATAAPDAETVIAWSGAGTIATIRLIAPSAETLADAYAYVASVVPVRRLDGDHLRGWQATLPLALTGSQDSAPASGPDPAGPLAIPPSGVTIGDDRAGRRLRLRLPVDGSMMQIIVVGGLAAAHALEQQAIAAGVVGHGVPLRIDVLDHATPRDAPALRAADVVICQPLAPKDAAAVAGALGLSETTVAWLSRIDQDMVAVIADGMVRWASMPAVVGSRAG